MPDEGPGCKDRCGLQGNASGRAEPVRGVCLMKRFAFGVLRVAFREPYFFGSGP